MVDEVLSLHVVNVDVGAVVVVADVAVVVVVVVVVAVVVVVVLMRAVVCERTPDADVAVVGPDAVGVAVAVADVDEVVVDVEMRLVIGVITQNVLQRRYVPHMKGEAALYPPPGPPAQWSQTALLGPQMPDCQ